MVQIVIRALHKFLHSSNGTFGILPHGAADICLHLQPEQQPYHHHDHPYVKVIISCEQHTYRANHLNTTCLKLCYVKTPVRPPILSLGTDGQKQKYAKDDCGRHAVRNNLSYPLPRLKFLKQFPDPNLNEGPSTQTEGTYSKP